MRIEKVRSRRFGVVATALSVLACFCVTVWGAVPPPSETPARVVVNGRTSTAIDVKIVKVGQELPDTFSAPECKSIPGYDWYVSEHFALRSQVDEAQSRQYLLFAELAYPHYVWIFGREPEGIGKRRIALSFSRNLQELKKATDVDQQYWRGGGGGVTMWGNGMSYNYPGGGLQAHRRGLVMHENLHAFHMALNGSGKGLQGWPSWFFEGITYALEQHVYDPATKQLTVMVLDRAVGNNYTDSALATLRAEPLTISDIWFGKEGLGYQPDIYQLVMQFIWSDLDRQMRFRVWQNERLRRRGNDRALLESLFDIDTLNEQWLAWVKDRQNTFHWVDWGMEQNGDTFWTYGYPNWARYVQLNINLLLKDKAEADDPYLMDWPVYSPQPHHLIGDVSRGGGEPSVGCLVDFSRAIRECGGWGLGGLGFGVGGTGKRADGKSNVDQEYLAVFVANIGRAPNADLRFDGETIGVVKAPEKFAPDFLSAARAGQVVGMTATLREEALEIVLRAGPAQAVKTHKTDVPLTSQQRERLLTRPWCLVSHAAYMGLTPYAGVHRAGMRDFSEPEPAGRTRFLATNELAELYALCHQLDGETPATLLGLRGRLLASATQPLAAQRALRDEYLAIRPSLLADVTAVKDKTAALGAVEVLTGFRWDASVAAEGKPGKVTLDLRASIDSSDTISGRMSFAVGEEGAAMPDPVAFRVTSGEPFSGRAVLSFEPHAQMPTSIEVALELVVAGHTFHRTREFVAYTSVARWLVLGPFDNKGDGMVDTVLEPETEPFQADKEYVGHGGRKIQWELRDRHRDTAPVTPTALQFTGNDNAAYYALTWIESPREQHVVLAIGSDDGVVVWLNDERVHANLIHRGHVFKQDRVKVRLRKGMNKLMLKVTQAWGTWQSSVFVLGEHGGEVTGLRNWLGPEKKPAVVKPSEIDHHWIQSEALNRQSPAYVVLPKNYHSSKKRYPVVFYLHAWTGKASPTGKNIADKYGVIMVSPDGGHDSWYFDSPNTPFYNYETHIVKEVVDFVDRKYRTIGTREGRAIMGRSMGGHGAMLLALRHPDVFSAVGSIHGGLDIRPFHDKWGMGIDKRLGPKAKFPQRYEKLTAINNIKNIKNRDLAIIFDCGNRDFFIGVNRAFRVELQRRSIEHSYEENSGEHGHFVAESMDKQLAFFSRHFRSVVGENQYAPSGESRSLHPQP